MREKLSKERIENLLSNVRKMSTDPHTKVGCIIVKDGEIIAMGYNHFPDDYKYPTTREGEFLDTKYPYIIHAEADALIGCTKEQLYNAVMYASLFPCNECAKLISLSGIKTIYYQEDKYRNTKEVIASKLILGNNNIKYEQM